MSGLLAVDVGLRSGLARYGRDGRLIWCRSTNFGARARLKAGVRSILGAEPGLELLIIEGGGGLAEIWANQAARAGLMLIRVSAEEWRERLLAVRERRNGAMAKRRAALAAKLMIDWSGIRRPSSLTHDAAEAVMVGMYGVLAAGWIDSPPPGLGGATRS